MEADKRKRLVQLLGMMGSAHDGEVLNAARLAQRVLGSEGATWEEVLNHPGGFTHDSVRTIVTEAYDRGYQAGITKGLAHGREEARKQAQPQAQPARPRIPKTWQGFARELRDNYDDDLTEWEHGFVESFIERGFYTPTPKQQAIFERIADKCGLECPE